MIMQKLNTYVPSKLVNFRLGILQTILKLSYFCTLNCLRGMNIQ